MIRRLAALAGIGLLVALLALAVWTVHQHRTGTAPGDAQDVVLSAIPPAGP